MITKPHLLVLNQSNIPPELCQLNAWIGWKFVLREGLWIKQPINLKTGALAKSDDPATWSSFKSAIANFRRLGCDGIGLCRTGNLIFIDLDGVLDPAGNIREQFPWAKPILAAVKGRAYFERSVSGTGLHAVCRGTLPPGRRQFDEPNQKHTGVALYDAARYFTFSGSVLPESGPISDLTTELAQIHALLFPASPRNGARPKPPLDLSDSELLAKARAAANGAAFTRLFAGEWEGDYASQSEADLGLCCRLTFWTGRDAERIDRPFRQSGLYRDKWQRDDYRERTIRAAITQTVDIYEPRNGRPHVNGSAESNAPADTTHEKIHKAQGPEDWPKPEPLQTGLPPVEAFSEDLLPDSFRPLVADVTDRMQVPIDYPAAVMVLCLAGVVSRRAVIQPKANDTGWVVVPNLWGGIIAPPGFMKSPVITAISRPFARIEELWRNEFNAELEEHKHQKDEADLRLSAWKEQSKQAIKKNAPVPIRPDNTLVEPVLKRLLTNDATFEKLHELMAQNPAGLLLIRDELTGWWSTLDKPGREGERAFCLECWNGDNSFTVDRIGRGTVHVPHCCMSMLGGIQPGRLRSYLVDALKDGPSNDGLIQRFQVLVWPDTTPGWRYVDRAPDAAAEQQVERVFRRLAEMDAEFPLRFRFAPDAQELSIEWLAELEAKVRGDELHPALVSHLAKYRSLMPSLALLFELADRVAGGSGGFVSSPLGNSPNFEVSLGHAQKAAAWCAYLESHARRVYSCIVTPQLRAAQELAAKIKRREAGADGFFSCRDVYRKGWTGLDTPEAVTKAAEVLEDAGWIRALSTESGPRCGRPSNRYQINPKVWQ